MSLFHTLKRFKVINDFFYGAKEDSEGAYVLFKDSYTLYQIKEKECRKIRDEYLHLERKYNELIKVTRELQRIKNSKEKHIKYYEKQLELEETAKVTWKYFCVTLGAVLFIILLCNIFPFTGF